LREYSETSTHGKHNIFYRYFSRSLETNGYNKVYSKTVLKTMAREALNIFKREMTTAV